MGMQNEVVAEYIRECYVIHYRGQDQKAEETSGGHKDTSGRVRPERVNSGPSVC